MLAYLHACTVYGKPFCMYLVFILIMRFCGQIHLICILLSVRMVSEVVVSQNKDSAECGHLQGHQLESRVAVTTLK